MCKQQIPQESQSEIVGSCGVLLDLVLGDGDVYFLLAASLHWKPRWRAG